LALLWAAPSALAAEGWTIEGNLAAATDYLFRGISQTRNGGAVQAGLEARHADGVYVGGFLSNTSFLGDPARQELDAFAGLRRRWAPIDLDLGLAAYSYLPAGAGARVAQYQAATLRLGHTDAATGLAGQLAVTLDLFEATLSSLAIEAGLQAPLPLGATGVLILGQQFTRANPRVATPDYLWYGVGLERELGQRITATLGWHATSIPRDRCAPVAGRAEGGQAICAGRLLFSLAWRF